MYLEYIHIFQTFQIVRRWIIWRSWRTMRNTRTPSTRSAKGTARSLWSRRRRPPGSPFESSTTWRAFSLTIKFLKMFGFWIAIIEMKITFGIVPSFCNERYCCTLRSNITSGSNVPLLSLKISLSSSNLSWMHSKYF